MFVHVVVDFFNRINIIYGVVSEFCTEETCPTMSGGAKYVKRVIIHHTVVLNTSNQAWDL